MVRDLYGIRPAIYWADFLLSMTVGYAAATVYLEAPLFSWPQIVCFFIGAFALYRLAMFMHEIVHFRKSEMRGFAGAWNLLAGIPMLMPSFFYESHRDHHNARHYGTKDDGEYLPLGNGTWRDLTYFFAQVFLQPIFTVLRFTLVTPISFLHPRLRQWTLERVSSFVIDLSHRRTIPADAPRTAWAWLEVGCSLRAWLIFGMILAGLNPWWRMLQLYALASFILVLNYARTLAAHRFLSDGSQMTHEEQLFDSIDITGGPVLTELLCPVGLRYHALHHLFPTLPYYQLGEAHRRLLDQLPADSAYREIVYPNWWAVIKDLRANMRAAAEQRFRQSAETTPRPAAPHFRQSGSRLAES
jgi:fatty acid desaturase